MENVDTLGGRADAVRCGRTPDIHWGEIEAKLLRSHGARGKRCRIAFRGPRCEEPNLSAQSQTMFDGSISSDPLSEDLTRAELCTVRSNAIGYITSARSSWSAASASEDVIVAVIPG